MADIERPEPHRAGYSGAPRSSVARRPRLAPAARFGAGVVVLLLGLVAFGGSRVLAAGQRHAYDKGAIPPATYQLTAGKVYQLSAPGGVAALTKLGLLTTGAALNCHATDPTGVETQLSIQSTKDDPRDLTEFATFQAASTGPVHISCTGLARVFVDDAADAGTDVAGALMVLATALGVIGVAAVASGGYAMSEARSSEHGAMASPSQPSDNL
ncbi:MAG TPA: hypothetical protein VGH11_12705 [Jatrophihabitans sp.]|jgi:hypothetical protein